VKRLGRYLETLPDDFFTSPEARMQATSGDGSGQVAGEAADMEGEGDADGLWGGKYGDESRLRCMPYTGISLHHSPLNCPDLLYFYEQCYENKDQSRRAKGRLLSIQGRRLAACEDLCGR
jgi:hypothetical protein